MKISACYIVKNEEKNIARSLNSIKEYCDEIIVVDTGSTDNTVAEAQRCGAQVHYFDWCDDFAQARNYTLSLLTGDWIIFLDADEYYCGTVSLRSFIETVVVQYPHADAILVNCLADNEKGKLEDRAARIFKNNAGIKYQGIIHETICKVDGDLQFVYGQELDFIHTGYNKDVIEGKLRRNLLLLQKSVSLYGELPQHYYYLAECYFGLHEYEQALTYIRRALSVEVRYSGKEISYYHILIESMRQCGYSLAVQEKAALEAAEKYPDNPEFYGELGMLHSSMGKMNVALQDLLACVDKYFHREKCRQYPGYMDAAVMKKVYMRLFMVAGELSEPMLAEMAAALVKMSGADKELTGRLKNLSVQMLANLDEAGQEAYKHHQVNRDGKYWLELWQHVQDMDAIIGILQGENGELKAEEQELLQIYDTPELRSKAVSVLMSARQADAWLLVKLALTTEVGILPHEQTFLSPSEKKLWQVVAAALTCKEARDMASESAPLVSIMIPTYNMPGLFARSLRSAALQDYPRLEIIVCDNSTNEETAQLMEMYKYDKRVRYVRNRKAQSKAENFAAFAELAQGEYLQWLMHDDILAPHKVSKMAYILYRDSQVKLVSSQRRIIDYDGNEQYNEKFNLPEEVGEGRYKGLFIGKQELKNCNNRIGEPGAVLFRRKDLTHHYWQAEVRGYKTISDMVMWLELLEKGDWYFYPQVLSYYRRHENQEGQTPDIILLSRIEMYNLLTEYFRRQVYIENRQEYTEALQGLVAEYDNLAEIRSAGTRKMQVEYDKIIGKCKVLLKKSK